MDVKMLVQSTPNPYAKKIVCNLDVKSVGKSSFSSGEDCVHIPLAKVLFELEGVSQVHFFENVVTITQDGSVAWDDLIQDCKEVIVKLLPEHDPNFKSSEENRREELSPELKAIEEILDRTIRPALQGDGGDLQLLALDGHLLTIRYEGACGSCPSATSGTLAAIQGILRDEYDPKLDVIPIFDDPY
ncbi:MAG: NifU family protein [Pseudobacteriovorax sp.]|nr:NifU family protein [Pseudobacteriovorax sp.]